MVQPLWVRLTIKVLRDLQVQTGVIQVGFYLFKFLARRKDSKTYFTSTPSPVNDNTSSQLSNYHAAHWLHLKTGMCRRNRIKLKTLQSED